MPLDGVYEPSPSQWVRDQVELYESSGGTRGTTMRGLPVVLVTSVGAKSGKLRKTPLMRVEHEGAYALVASNGGSAKHPVWYHNLVASPRIVLRDATRQWDMRAGLVTGGERREWWDRAVRAFPDYADYQLKAEREIPLFVAEPIN
ncbi:nitroreductase family deazaflavin-dependent oxidoreductase [Streptomyces roseolus]|uniref:nitroreductase family deazaflavin-dependent oxidoreductase n=1 Tax=Streptomyces roseolus TaxID=67358 RepID=UPI003402BB44